MGGQGASTRVHYRGTTNDFVFVASSSEAIEKYRKLPLEQRANASLVDVVDSFQVFTTSKHGNQGVLDRASNGMLENEFGTKNQEAVIRAILEKGDVKITETKERGGNTNLSNGSLGGHN